jgi:hypothetical protein
VNEYERGKSALDREAPAEQTVAARTRPAPLADRHSAVLSLQRAAGNRAVANLMTADRDDARGGSGGAVRSVHMRSLAVPLSATIRCADRDAAPGAENAAELDPGQVAAELGAAAAPAGELLEGETIRLPDMVVTPAGVADTDTVGGTIAYSGTITQSGAVNPFGATSWGTFTLTGITLTRAPGAFTVAATLSNPITFNVASGGRTHLASENDAALTSVNYATAVSDLTPNMADLGGRPPRTRFWAEDLTIRHERFHADERHGHALAGSAAAQGWLAAQTANSAAAVQALLQQVPARVIAFSQAAMPYPAKEERAYGDGAPSYQARADAIRTKGAAGGYPAPPTP